MVASKQSQPSGEGPGARSLFAAFLEEEPESKTDDLEELCARHSKHAQALRKLWSKHREVGRLIEGAFPDVEAEDPLPSPGEGEAPAGGGSPAAHNQVTVGQILLRRERFAQAAEAFERALQLDPEFALAHCCLGHALSGMGQHRRALEHMRRGHELGARRSSWSRPSQEWVRILESEVRWRDLVEGQVEARDTEELIWASRVCYSRGLFAAAVPLYSRAFDQDPIAAGGHHFNAACTAALAAAGGPAEGPAEGNGPPLEPGDLERFRSWAREWLECHLANLTKALERGKAPRYWLRQMGEWRTDPDLATLREPQHLVHLPRSEREAWERLWCDVDAFLARIGR